MSVAIDDQQVRRRISSIGLGETLFVEAGAGTGKTTQLVSRVVNLVLSGRVPLRQIAAITFTEAAAAELRDRIRVAFEREAATTDDEDRRQRCLAAVAEADQAAFSTLHGFALRILSEHPMAAGLPPRLQIADEITSQLAFADRWERFVDGLYNRADLEPLLVQAALLDVPLEPRYPRQASLVDVASILNQSWDRLEMLAAQPVTPLPPPDTGPFDRAVADLAAAAATCCDPTDRLAGHLRTILPEMADLVAVADPQQKVAALRGCSWTKTNTGRAAAWNNDVAGVKALIEAVNAAADAAVRQAAGDVLERFKLLIAAELWAAADARRREGRLEFHDLLVLARRALRTSAATRHSLSQRFRCLLLDEFQDTDPLQIELAVLIAGTVTGEVAAWTDTPVEPGRLFFVGDPKQSIYRFRRADIKLFLDARDTFGVGDALVRLSTNFRTVEPIIEWVNTLFDALMPAELSGRQPRYEPLIAERQPSGADHRVVLLGGPCAGLAGDVRQQEARAVADVIDDIRQHPSAWPVEDHDGWRPANLSDITVLLPTRISLPYLRAELDRADIPFRLDTGTLVFDTQEVRDVLAAVRAIDDPTDEASLVAALRSPLYGCSDVELFTWRQAGQPWSVSRMPEGDLTEHPVGRAISHLHALWLERWWLPAGDLVERLVRERQALMAAFGDPRPTEVWRRLRFLVDQARAFDASHGGGIRAFCEWAELQASSSSRVHEPLGADTDHATVRVMTVHGAKGLEFPITILTGMSTQPAGRRAGANAIWDGDDLHLSVGSKVKTDNFDPRAEIEDEMSDSERVRLLYVAATRARDHLVVSCYHSTRAPKSPPYGRLVHDTMAAHGHLHRPPPAVAGEAVTAMPEVTVCSAVDHDRHAWMARRAALLAGAGRRRFASATSIAAEAAALPADGDADEMEPDAEEETGIAWRRGRAGTAIGRAVHATLQSLDLSAARAEEMVAAIARREATVEAIPEAADTVAAMVRSALRSHGIGLARRYPHHKELYVAATVGGQVIEGYVDLLVETPDGLVIVDYKTDTVRSEADVEAKLARYELQGAAYAVALERTTGLAVSGCRFVFCRPAGAIERQIADLPAARQRVLAAVGGDVAGTLPGR